MAEIRKPIVFLVPGQPTRAVAGGTRGGPEAAPAGPWKVKAGVRVGAVRGGDGLQRLEAMPGEDVVALHLAGGPVLYLHPETARDLMLAQAGLPAQRGKGAAVPEGDVAVPVDLRWRGLEQAAPTRGKLGDVILGGFELLTGFVKDKAVDFAAGEVVRRVDGQVEAGVYTLAAGALGKLKASGRRVETMPAAGSDPILVLVHGTFVETTSTFGKWWAQHPGQVASLFDRYAGRVFALDHPTLGASPIANALTLAKACPKGARLHLVTHSRGGLVAEVLARAAHQRRVGEADRAFFKGAEYAGQRADLEALVKLVAENDIRVERVVRVACPARGTLLASKRLDAYLSVLKWTLDLASVPLLPGFVDFVAEVARRRADPAELPGLAAMMPGSPLVQWLNAAPEPIAGDLRVVAGDLEGDSLGGWIKTLLADAYYWTDNDIVVQTRSMYGGAPRAGGASFLLDQGGRSTHFNYFANVRTAAGITQALVNATPPEGFFPIGRLSWAGESSTGIRGRARGGEAAPQPGKPAVFVLPGILGSNLKADGHRIWLAWRLVAGLERLRYEPQADDGTPGFPPPDGVEPDGPLSLVYDDLVEFLSATHEVIEFGFDWRRPIEREARRLAAAVDAALAVRQASGQPVRLLAHSMGGVLARTMQLERPDTWNALMARRGARLVMLGTPNGGSWAPMQVLSGDDTFGNTLVALGSPFSDAGARRLMAAMPGFIQLQAGLTDPHLGLDREDTWRQLGERDYERVQQANWWHRNAGETTIQSAYRWGVPPQAVLDQAIALRRRLDAQREHDLPAFAGQMALVVGHASATPAGFEEGANGFVYLDANDGDGRVPLESALLPGVPTWKLDEGHGSLPSAKGAFDAFLDLLESGQTTRLEPLSATRGGAPAQRLLVRSRPSREPSRARPPQDERAVLGGAAAPAAAPGSVPPLAVTVLNGNLAFVPQPLMVGHYRSVDLTGTERVLDGLVGHAMLSALRAGLYPEAIGTHQVFENTRRREDNPWGLPRPAAAIVIGLGDEGVLDERQLVESVRQAVLAWAQRRAEARVAEGGAGSNDQVAAEASSGIELAATLIGSGGFGISAGAAARAIASGVHEANRRIAATAAAAAAEAEAGGAARGRPWPLIGRLTLVELFLERATDAWRGLKVLETASPGVCTVAPDIASGHGARRRPPDMGYRGTNYDLVRIASDGADGIEFTLDTRRARTEVRADKTQGRLVRELVAAAAQHGRNDGDIGRTLFQLLVPVELEPFLGGTDCMVLDLDEKTAPIPWELLDTRPRDALAAGAAAAAADPRPWALRSQMLRKLRTETFRQVVRDARADDKVLVIGEPIAPDDYPPLPAARAEAEAVHAALTGAGGIGFDRVNALLGDADAAMVINALMAHDYRIVHVAGHGEPPEGDDPRGVVLSGGVFLGANEIRKMRSVPELVFVNCCHLAGHGADGALHDKGLKDRPRFAAGVADALIEIGVRCVVAAGWAVDDGPAREFAEAFYAKLLAGGSFIGAVGAARQAAWAADPGGKTWAAYQCYGDPGWVYRRDVGDAQGVREPTAEEIGAEFDGIASAPALALTLEDLAIRARTESGFDFARLTRQLEHLYQRFDERYGAIGAVAEAFGLAWESAKDRDRALACYARALEANDATASLKSAEALANLRARRAWKRIESSRGAPDAKTFEAARREIVQARDDLLALARLYPSIERWSLVGAACKRLVLLEWRAARPARGARPKAADAAAAALEALKQTHAAYARAEQLASAAAHPQLFYPAVNRITAELVLHADDASWRGLDAKALAKARASLEAKHREDPDFWSAAGLVELTMYEALAAGKLADRQADVMEGFAEVRRRRSHTGDWESVAAQAAFVLQRWAGARAASSAREAAAAKALLARLEQYAQ